MCARDLMNVRGEPVPVPDGGGLTHLQFRRFAGCPICDLHLHAFVERHEAIVEAGVRDVVVFHSSAEELRTFSAEELPFAVIPDPEKLLYAEFGVESAPRALLNPRAWGPIVRGVSRSVALMLRGRHSARMPAAEGGRLGLPADFLIAPNGVILENRYGEHAYDQWSVDDVLALADARRSDPLSHDGTGQGITETTRV